MPEQPKSRLDRELEEILQKKSREQIREPIPFSSHPNAPKTKGGKLIQDVRTNALTAWQGLSSVALLLAFTLAIFARIVSDISPLLALLLSAWAVGAIWWPGIKRLMQRSDYDEPDVKYWRGRAYTTEIKDFA